MGKNSQSNGQNNVQASKNKIGAAAKDVRSKGGYEVGKSGGGKSSGGKSSGGYSPVGD